MWGGNGQWQCLEERDGSGNLVARFVYSPGYVDAVARQERDLNSDDDFGGTNEVVWYHSNTLYSIYALSDGSESVIERYRYDAYGGCTVLDADGSDDSDGLSDVCDPYAFTARRLDLESDLMYYRNRQYSATLGRFVSRDPAAYIDSFNVYEYGVGSTTNCYDPFGYWIGGKAWKWLKRVYRRIKYCWTNKPNPNIRCLPRWENEEATIPGFCKDTKVSGMLHSGKYCYRQINCARDCQQCCYWKEKEDCGKDKHKKGELAEQSPDHTSSVKMGSDGVHCAPKGVGPVLEHFVCDVVPWAVEGGRRGFRWIGSGIGGGRGCAGEVCIAAYIR